MGIIVTKWASQRTRYIENHVSRGLVTHGQGETTMTLHIEDSWKLTDTGAWRPAPGWPGYFVSCFGDVLSIKNKDCRCLRHGLTRGYPTVTLSDGPRRKTVAVHLLVLLAFVGPRPTGAVCRHLNGIRNDNRLANLQWGTPRENYDDRDSHGTTARGERAGVARLSDADVLEARELYRATNITQATLAEMYGVSRTAIRQAIIDYKNPKNTWAHLDAKCPRIAPRLRLWGKKRTDDA